MPYLFHQLLYFFYIGFIDIARGVHTLCNLVQIVADTGEDCVVFPQVFVVHVIDISVQDQVPYKDDLLFIPEILNFCSSMYCSSLFR